MKPLHGKVSPVTAAPLAISTNTSTFSLVDKNKWSKWLDIKTHHRCAWLFNCVPVPWCHTSLPHRHKIDKYLDTLLANQPISDGEATDHCQKGVPQDGGLPELIVARSCPTNHSEAASLWLVTPKQVVGDHQWRHWRVVCCNIEDLNFGKQNLPPSNIKVIFQRPSYGSLHSGGFRFHCRYCPCGLPLNSISTGSAIFANAHQCAQQTNRQTDWEMCVM